MIVVMMIREGFRASSTDAFFLSCIFFVASRRNASYLTHFLFVYISASRMCRVFPHTHREGAGEI